VIFVLRGIMVSLAFFSLLYSFLSLALLAAWRCLKFGRPGKRLAANALFTLRVMPFSVAAAVSVFLTLPSFLLFEARAMDEDLGTFVLAACALALGVAGLGRVLAAAEQTRRVVSACLAGAEPLASSAGAVAVVSPQTVFPMMLVGLRAPCIVISESARRLLSAAELEAAVRHETQHLRTRDNLRKAILNCLPFPGMKSLEEAWQEAAELAADDGAVASHDEALDLAAALIKLTRHFPDRATPRLATGLGTVNGSLTARIERLLGWQPAPAANSSPWCYALPLVLVILLGLAVKVGPALAAIHALTDRLVP
jgi:hypothetical protein